MVEVVVCLGTDCAYRGGLQIHEYLEDDASLSEKIVLRTARCINRSCKPDQAPIVIVAGQKIERATLDKVLVAIRENLHES